MTATLVAAELPDGDFFEWPQYTEAQHRLWRTTLHGGFARFLGARVISRYWPGYYGLGLDQATDRAPDPYRLCELVFERSGIVIRPVPGWIREEDHFEKLLANGIYPGSWKFRDAEHPELSLGPDAWHWMVGHAPLFMSPAFGTYIRRFGELGAEATRTGRLKAFTMVYAKTIEFGLMGTPGEPKILGAGIISSREEVRHVFHPDTPRYPFDLEHVIASPFPIGGVQTQYFVLKDFDALERLLDDLRIRDLPTDKEFVETTS